MRLENSIFVALLFVVSCGDKEMALEENFIDERQKFEKVKSIVEDRYILSGEFDSQVRVVIINCGDFVKSTPKELCDEELEPLMKELSIKTISIEQGNCEYINHHHFNEIYFHLSSLPYQSAGSYLFDYCREEVDFKSDVYYQRSIPGAESWSVIIDSSFP